MKKQSQYGVLAQSSSFIDLNNNITHNTPSSIKRDYYKESYLSFQNKITGLGDMMDVSGSRNELILVSQ